MVVSRGGIVGKLLWPANDERLAADHACRPGAAIGRLDPCRWSRCPTLCYSMIITCWTVNKTSSLHCCVGHGVAARRFSLGAATLVSLMDEHNNEAMLLALFKKE
jgi:hypothetical protein